MKQKSQSARGVNNFGLNCICFPLYCTWIILNEKVTWAFPTCLLVRAVQLSLLWQRRGFRDATTTGQECMTALTEFPNFVSWHKRHIFIKLTTLMLSSSANVFQTSIVATLHHSQILIWIRLCHVRGLHKEAFSFFFSSPHSFLLPSPPSHLHAASSQAPLMCLL